MQQVLMILKIVNMTIFNPPNPTEETDFHQGTHNTKFFSNIVVIMTFDVFDSVMMKARERSCH